MQKNKSLLAAFAGLAFMLASPAMAQVEGQLSGEYSLTSNAFRDNILGDPKKRNISYTLPPSYWQRQSPGGPFVVANYPVVLILSGNNMYRNEGTTDALVQQRCHPADGTPSVMSPANQAQYCDPNPFRFDQDTIAYNLMATGQTPEFILLEVSGLSRYGGTRYDCSPIFGDMRSFVLRDIPADIVQRFRIRPGRENWFLAGFSMGAGGALAAKLEDREDRWGQLVMISPSNNDLSVMTAPDSLGRSEPSLLNLYRNFTGRVPQTNIPVHKVSGPDETAESWGKTVLGGKFLAGSVLATAQVVMPDETGLNLAVDGITPLYTTDPLTGPNVGDYDHALWDLMKAKGLKQLVQRSGENLTDTVVVIARGNNPVFPNAIFLPEVSDQPRLVAELQSRALLDAEIIVPGDHFTALPNSFPAAIKKAFELAGSKNGRPFTYNPTIENEHVPCAARFPIN